MNKAKAKEFIENQTTQKPSTDEESKNIETIFSDNDFLLNMVLDCSERYLPLSNLIGSFLSEKFLAELDKSFVASTLQRLKTNPIKLDNEAVLKEARERLNFNDYLIESRQALAGGKDANSN